MYDLVLRNVIYRMDPEFAHRFAVVGFRYGGRLLRALGGRRSFPAPPASAAVHALGMEFAAPLGLAAGMDKNGEAVRGLAAAGFSHIEIGTVTARAQPGNDRPRSFREKDVRGLRNRMGFNNEGADAVARRLARLRSGRKGGDVILGVNIGKTKVTSPEDAPTDYGYSARLLAPYADYLVVNVSSPNTPGLRDLQSTDALRPILEHVRAAADDAVGDRHVPLLVKIAPDLADEDVDAVADLAVELGLDGIVATNTTIGHDRGPGGLSGPPLLPRALEVITRLRARVGPGMCLVGVGGITTVADARAMLAAGATLLQGYTAFVYEGPAWPARINAALGSR
ncbi:quinone-dependent dihydroorotate dehydrogenase [Demequina capsici]|uniref:Dihydroorotate dehydrogenase (quinone) n=1 Tax=Demequina capsici TaxID=3075620 RepID=A0AA96J7X0_9MICO|nr:quinone-dependent dihydroorotate dehydrogenase [Demequina sp. OYTSA14]WNM25662.1 quinone-dependent dihydroorotate dehydrogenase [Demequina sp. OYTSA14]